VSEKKWRHACLQGLALCWAIQAHHVHAQQELEFDERFLELGGGHPGADLSVFAKRNQLQPGRYLVDIDINQQRVDSQEIRFDAPDPEQDAQPCLTAPMFAGWGVNVAAFPALANAAPQQCVDIGKIISAAQVSFDSYQHQLNISIPQAAMKRRARGAVDPARWDQGVNAAVLDYQLSAAQYSGSDYASVASRNSLYAGLRGGVNFGAWRLSHSSTYNRGTDGVGKYQIINSFLQRDIAAWNSRLTLGDATTPSNIFDGFQFRGVQLNTDEAMLPDSQQGYAPTIHGVAQTSAQVTVRQNGFVIYSTFVPPGPFVINDLYPTSSSGDLEVTVIEADGRKSSFVQPYSALPLLLRAGSWRYNLSSGQYRNGFSSSHPSFVMGTAARGFSGEFSLYGGSIAANIYQAALLGVGKNIGSFGALSLDVTHARSKLSDNNSADVSGNSLRFLYAKSLAAYGTDFRVLGYRYSSAGYRSFPDAVALNDGSLAVQSGAKHERLEGTITQRLKNAGSLYATVGMQSYWGTNAKSNLLQLGYSASTGRISYGVYGSYNKGNGAPSNWQVAFNLSLPLSLFGEKDSSSGNLSYFVSRNDENHLNQQATYSDSLGVDRQFNYSLSAAHSNQSSISESASASYLAPYGRYDVSAAHGSGYAQTTLTAAGGVVGHSGGVLFSQPLGETVAIVEIPDVKGVHFEMHPGVSTNRAGDAVIPYLNPYRVNRIVIDTQELPKDVEIKSTVEEVVPTRAAVVMASFEPVVGHQVAFALTMADGKPLPLGALVENDEGQELGMVGQDGEAFISGLTTLQGHFVVRWHAAAEQQCRVDYALPEKVGEENSDDEGYQSVVGRCR
jgi:outer membrane usher protein